MEAQSDRRETGLSADAEQRRESFACFGLAMYRAQCVETQLAMLLATTFNLDFLRGTPEERDKYLDTELLRTLGQLLTSLRTVATIPQALDGRLSRALRLRNWLAHDYFRERSVDILSWDGRDRMIMELLEAAEFLGSVDEELTGITEAWFVSKGVSRETIEAEMHAFMLDSAKP